MGIPYAEVIGDPVAHSKSPLIHKFWLEKLGMRGDYRATQMTKHALPAYLDARRNDIHWRGCNVTAPLKEAAAALVGTPVGLCTFLGAVNCITRTPLGCEIGTNTDLAGIAEALSGISMEGSDAVLIGAGGAARAALCYLLGQHAGTISIVARNEASARALSCLVPSGSTSRINVASLDQIPAATPATRAIINATPMGMRGKEAMSPQILEWLKGSGEGMVAFDMVYDPVETAFLSCARSHGMTAVDGLTMLIGQAAPAFELFFGRPAPRRHDRELRTLLTS